MKRQIVNIDRDKCNGCGLCIPNCQEGALQILDGKATLVSDLMCDGLGACIGYCPEGAISIEEREAVPYDEVMVIKGIIPQGKNVIIAHLKHLKQHEEFEYMKQGVTYLRENQPDLTFDLAEVVAAVHAAGNTHQHQHIHHDKTHAENEGGCPGSRERSFAPASPVQNDITEISSELRQWPVQLHLVNPVASYFKNSDLVLTADCVAYTIANFHQKYLRGKSIAIACPKLDSNKEIYIEKITRMIDESLLNTITVMKMEVPCCSGLLQIAQIASRDAKRKIPVKSITVGIQGDIQEEQWV
ncbi:MAG: 4Fe-4S binding protein [Bacteroidia bacterium]|nr:4Fe-4S binding protein [Bacteroidia bacterium]